MWTLDLGSQGLAAARRPVSRAARTRCENIKDGDVLGTAIVVYGRKLGLSAWGHASVRFLACEQGEMVDEEVEAYRFTPRTFRQLASRHPGAAFATDPLTLRRNRGRLYLRVVPDPVDDGHYARQLARNREIYELWLPLEPGRAQALRADFHARARAQTAAFEAGRPIPEGRYVGMGRNCTLPALHARTALAGRTGGAPGPYPMRILADLASHPDVVRVLHPSPHALRKALEDAGDREAFVASLPGPVGRPRPLLRRSLPTRQRYWAAHLAERTGGSMAPPLRAPSDPPNPSVGQ
ncbi:MAG: hypothetical protein VX000_18035 [Myxococcota bacterium]|nr:hypothetical protein [Myxococcota bacterium]